MKHILILILLLLSKSLYAVNQTDFNKALEQQNLTEANNIYNKLCSDKKLKEYNSTDCFELALELSIAESKDQIKEACKNGDAEICNNLGVESYNSNQPNYFESIKFFEQACKRGSALGCNNLGLMYHDGKGARQNSRKALDFFGKSCDMKEQQGCTNYAKLKKELGL